MSPLVGAVLGDASNAVTLTFPGACGAPPNPPTAFSVSAQGGRVFVDWLPPTTGAAAVGYVVSVSGAVSGSFPTQSRTLAVPVPPGRSHGQRRLDGSLRHQRADRRANGNRAVTR